MTFVPRVDRGRVDGYVATLEDITRIRKLEADRERLAQQRTEILDSMGDGFFTLDEPFTRAVAKLDSASRSVELGLYIVRSLVVAHGGTVEARSAEDDGTTFIVRLPRCTTNS